MKKLSGLLCLVVLAAAPARAAWKDISAADFTMPDPPQNGSRDYDRDFVTLLRQQQIRTNLQCELGKGMKKPDFVLLFEPSQILTAQEMLSVKPFMDKVAKRVSAVDKAFKQRYARPRPFNEDAGRGIQPCADEPGGATSYPSSHATHGTVEACVLGKIFPDRAERFANWGHYVGELRVIVGVHHPSDVLQGQILGDEICTWLMHQPDFNDAIAAEVAKLHGQN